MTSPAAKRVRKRRAVLRAAGLRPIQIWATDTRRPGFAEEARRQSQLAAASELSDQDLSEFLDAGVADMSDA